MAEEVKSFTDFSDKNITKTIKKKDNEVNGFWGARNARNLHAVGTAITTIGTGISGPTPAGALF